MIKMDLEAMQLLNLSPIPELSEIELSTMLDHLSGLSDVNGDLTDRNVEDIIKEAEDLLDRSTSSQVIDTRDIKTDCETEKKASNDINQRINSLDESEDCDTQESNFNEIEQDTDPVNDAAAINHSFNEENNKHFNSPVESTSTTVYSPGSTTNHIKSTIDSLKEYSTLVEKKLSSQNSSPKINKKYKLTEKSFESKQINVSDVPQVEKLISVKQPINGPKPKPPDLTIKKTKSDKSSKLLNCFDRLYQVKPPVKLPTVKRPKSSEKTLKTGGKKKLKDLKNTKNNNWQEKYLERFLSEDAKNGKMTHHPSSPTFVDEGELSRPEKGSLKYFLPSNFNQKSDRLTYGSLDTDFERSGNKQIQSRIDEKLILKVLEEMEEIKDQVRKVGVTGDNPGRVMKDETTPEGIQPEKESTGGKANCGIQRLEQKFATLKEKYDYQLEKLEAENSRLREALISKEKCLQQGTISEAEEVPPPVESTWTENCKAPKNSPCSSPENRATVKEAFSQTEEEPKSARREVGTDAEEIFPEGRKAENKENVSGGKKRTGKCKPFSDVNVHQSARRKSLVDHESQLLATLRGLQAEVTAKDKESRKLKSEIESLRKQMKKLTGCKVEKVEKVENCRRFHAGTQTIGLPIVQKLYNPENYEVPQEFERENEDLRSRIKALEEDFELLKEKRITDLQALHQVHEEEMAKLVSKLETQSALTKHLHSLLVNR